MAVTLDARVEEKLRALVVKHDELTRQLSDPEVVSDLAAYRTKSKEFAQLGPLVEKYALFLKGADESKGARGLLLSTNDAEMKAMAQEEIKTLDARLSSLEAEIKALLLPSDPNDAKNVVLEIRAGTGGDEATLFAAEMFRMYSRYAESQG